MRAHSMEIRECIIRAIEESGLTQEEIAEEFGVSSRWVRWFNQRRLTTGLIGPQPHGGGPSAKITPAVDEQLREFVKQHPDATLAEIRSGCGLTVSVSAICQALKRLGLRRKKKVLRAAERDQPGVQAKRLIWKHRTCQVGVKRLIFLDQTAVTTRMQRAYGRAPSGVRVIGVVPEKHYQTSTLMGAMRLDGTLESIVYDGGTDVAAMLAFIESQLAPVLKASDIVIWDNLSAHHSPAVIQAIEHTGARVWPLPPYSPDLNPIEQLWSKIKSILRGVAARTKDALINGLALALEKISPSDIQNWFTNCGYRKIHA